ncbi:MAG: 6-hydroxymethylpterin diphosphokinase MptE-like protein [Candidatus Heimdallarchaeota archaeon]
MVEYEKLTLDEYNEICSLLNIDPQTDISSVEFLHKRLNKRKMKTAYNKLEKKISNRIIFIFGAGPSLNSSLNKVQPIVERYHKKITIIAVDGATKALQENDLPIDIIVTDLDGSISSIQEEYNKGAIVVIHAHGDNKDKINQIISILDGNNVIGTSQSLETSKVKNLGGFSDGDRAVYLSVNFKGKIIVLFAFDFGEIVGRYSKPEIFTEDTNASKEKIIKFDFAKKLLAKIPLKFPEIMILNCTPQGEEITSIRQIDFQQLEEILDENR